MARILVVEDYPALLALYREWLDQEYECRAVGTTEEALAELEMAEFNVVVA